MSTVKQLIDLAKDRDSLARKNPRIDLDLLRKSAEMTAGVRRGQKQYELKRAFEDAPQVSLKQIQARSKAG